MKRKSWVGLAGFLVVFAQMALAGENPTATQSQVFESTFESQKIYADPFNDVDVDVVFMRDGQSWRVPTFWRGGSKWTVRFAPPAPGDYSYRLESTDKSNPDLNGHDSTVKIAAYDGTNTLLRHGMIRISANRRYFEFTDGTPFYWLGDTWWDGLSDRLPWDGFRRLTADRKAKGFTAIQIVAGLIPSNEELAPSDPGFCNEGGCAWTPDFEQINPGYFDYADRRIQYLIDNGLVPVIVGGWRQVLEQMGVAKMEKHWRYIIARYGAYPVLWLGGGEVYDKPTQQAESEKQQKERAEFEKLLVVPGWTEVVRYIRAADPYHHPLSIHEIGAPFDTAIADESLTDFDLFQPGHSGWPSIATEVAQLDKHYARRTVTKPLVVGEVVYEGLGGSQMEDMQRAAFWLGMLNGAAGFTYGTISVAEAYDADHPFHRRRLSLITWDEGMNLPGSHEVGIGANLLKTYPWWQLAPHPEWVTPHGTTLLEPNDQVNGFDIDLVGAPGDQLPRGEWQRRKGDFRLPYAAGIPGKARVVYLPYFGFNPFNLTPTVLGLETAKRYHAFYWDPITGTKFDLGAVERPEPGAILFVDDFDRKSKIAWTDYSTDSQSAPGTPLGKVTTLSVANAVTDADLVVSIETRNVASQMGLALRFHDLKNYLEAVYSPDEEAIYLLDRKDGEDGERLASTSAPILTANIMLSAEVRGRTAAISVTDGVHTYTSAIVDVTNLSAGGVGLLRPVGRATQTYAHFEVRQSPRLLADTQLERKLYDAEGRYRGEWIGPGLPALAAHGRISMDDWGKGKQILLDAYRPDRPPFYQDWVLVLEALN
jgi:hypothetical protein